MTVGQKFENFLFCAVRGNSSELPNQKPQEKLKHIFRQSLAFEMLQKYSLYISGIIHLVC